MRTLLIFLTVLICFSSTLWAGAWAQKKNSYYTKLTFIYSQADGIFGSDSPALFDDYALYFYGEYGLFNNTSLILSTPFFKHSTNEADFIRGRNVGYLAGDLEIQGKYQFLSRPLVAAVLGGVKLPVIYDINDIPPLGNGETDLDAKLLLGGSFYPIPAYMTGDIGYRLRGGNFINEIQYNFEAGYTLASKYLLRFVLNGIQSTETPVGDSNLFGFPLDQEKTRLGGGLIYLLNSRVELDITYLKTTAGKNIPKTTEFFIGIAFKR